MESPRPAKLSYHTPVLTLHGDMRDLTAASPVETGGPDAGGAGWGTSPLGS
jgi:hypothetical protein